MVISLISHKGGCGKSTTAIHLAEILAKSGSVLLIDTDASCNLTNFYGAGTSKKTVIDFLDGNRKAFAKTERGISIVPGHKSISSFDAKYYAAPDVYAVIKDAVSGMPFDFIIIDTPHAIGNIIKNTIIASDVMIMPVMPTSWSADGTVDVLDELEELKAKGRKKQVENVRPALLPCAVSIFSSHDRSLVPSLRMAHPGIDILPRVPFNRSIMRDQSEGVVKKTNVYRAYEEVAKWLLQ